MLVDDQGWGQWDTQMDTECLILLMKTFSGAIAMAKVISALDPPGPPPGPYRGVGEMVWEEDKAHDEQLVCTPSLRAEPFSHPSIG